jgi:AcrR family transcriptional regulator
MRSSRVPGLRTTHSRRQALETRRLIAEAAGRLFLEGGYAATTMDAIAKEAGVAVSTVYAAFKNKRAVLREIRMGWHERTRAREINAEAARQPDPERGAGLISTYLCGRPLLEERLCGRRTPLTGWSREWKIVTL